MTPAHAVLRRLRERVIEARAAGGALEIRGGATKAFYGHAPRGAPLEVGELAGITSYEPTELVVTTLAGTRLAELEAVLAKRGQCLPFEPPRFAPHGTVGGMVAAGLSGPARASVGPLRDYVLGVTLLDGHGETVTFGGQVMKNVAGYDVSRALAGSMGILGVICEVSLKVMPVAPACETYCMELTEAAALAQLKRWAAAPFPLQANAFHQDHLWVRLAGAQAAVELARTQCGRRIDPAAAGEWWDAVRDHRHEFFALGSADLDRGECLWRLSLPDAVPPVSLPGAQFIEWGGTQRWWRGTAPAAVVRGTAARAGGHATLVRGADKSSGVFDALSPPLHAIHQRLKHSFDPAGIFNPGRLYLDL